jgi:hypothetical protein
MRTLVKQPLSRNTKRERARHTVHYTQTKHAYGDAPHVAATMWAPPHHRQPVAMCERIPTRCGWLEALVLLCARCAACEMTRRRAKHSWARRAPLAGRGLIAVGSGYIAPNHARGSEQEAFLSCAATVYKRGVAKWQERTAHERGEGTCVKKHKMRCDGGRCVRSGARRTLLDPRPVVGLSLAEAQAGGARASVAERATIRQERHHHVDVNGHPCRQGGVEDEVARKQLACVRRVSGMYFL